MEKYFKALSGSGEVEIPEQFTEKFGWAENTLLYQFTRGGDVYITDRKPEYPEKNLRSALLDASNRLAVHKELLDEVGIGVDERLAVYVFYDNIIGLAKDFRECVVCGKTSELAPVKDRHICYDCALLISGIEDCVFK